MGSLEGVGSPERAGSPEEVGPPEGVPRGGRGGEKLF